jgi:hypothetical protein
VQVPVEPRVVAADVDGQLELHPAGQVRALLARQWTGTGRSSSLLAQQRAGLAEAVHAEEEQLLAPHPAQVPLPDATAPEGTDLEPGLQPDRRQ